MARPGRAGTGASFAVPRLALTTLATGALLIGIFAAMMVRFRADLRDEIHETIIGRDAAVLFPGALQQLAEGETARGGRAGRPGEALAFVLRSARQQGMLAVSVFDAAGNTLQSDPASLLFAELPAADYALLLGLEPVSHYHPALPLDRYFAGAEARAVPVLEVLLPLFRPAEGRVLGFAQYFIDARPLASELATIDRRIDRHTAATLAIGAGLIAVTMTGAYFGMRRAQRAVAERNERLARANFELTLAAKASALGQIASHLIHGLQGSVTGLRAVVAGRGELAGEDDWQSAAGYAERMQTMIQEAVALLADAGTQARYELSGAELVETIRLRVVDAADRKGVALDLGAPLAASLDNHRGSVLCLIADNLLQNAIDATPAGRRVALELAQLGGSVALSVRDEGSGIPEQVRPRLFEPGVSGRVGGTGLGLAISRLLARQIGAVLELVATGPEGTTFRVTLPLEPQG